MSSVPVHHYGGELNITSAQTIVPFLQQLFNPNSVADIGCGTGTWLKVFYENGLKDILGVDGGHIISTNQLVIPPENFKEINLSAIRYKDVQRTFDLVLCLEVAEHLKEIYADNFVETLCSLSKIIAFSAAVPGQTGEYHFNEQYPDYWAGKFKKHGYIFVDLIRPRFWEDENIEWWYRQNTFIAVEKTVADKYNFAPWDGKVYIIKDLLEMYTQHSNITKHSTSISALPRKIYRRLTK